MDRDHQPRSEFVADLEWQVRTELRRRDRFMARKRAQKGGPMKLASVILVSALFGAGGMVVKDEVRQVRAQGALLAQVETEMRLAELQSSLVRSQLEEVEGQVAAGAVDEEAVLSARLAMREASVRLQTMALDRAEILGTGREPANGISAPAVDGRDFVSERLALRLSVAEQHLQLAESRVARLQDLAAAGVIGEDELEQGLMALEEARLDPRLLRGKLDLRAQFLDGEITPTDAATRAALLEADRELLARGLARDRAARQLQRLQERAVLGIVPEAEVQRARLEVMRMELAGELARLRLEQLRREGGDGSR